MLSQSGQAGQRPKSGSADSWDLDLGIDSNTKDSVPTGSDFNSLVGYVGISDTTPSGSYAEFSDPALQYLTSEHSVGDAESNVYSNEANYMHDSIGDDQFQNNAWSSITSKEQPLLNPVV